MKSDMYDSLMSSLGLVQDQLEAYNAVYDSILEDRENTSKLLSNRRFVDNSDLLEGTKYIDAATKEHVHLCGLLEEMAIAYKEMLELYDLELLDGRTVDDVVIEIEGLATRIEGLSSDFLTKQDNVDDLTNKASAAFSKVKVNHSG